MYISLGHHLYTLSLYELPTAFVGLRSSRLDSLALILTSRIGGKYDYGASAPAFDYPRHIVDSSRPGVDLITFWSCSRAV